MISFIIGAVCIAGPPQVGVPLAVTAAGIKAIKGAVRRRKQAKERLPKSESEATLHAKFEKLIADEIEPVTLEWTDLQCTLKMKKGKTKQILRGVSGVARPGRLVALMGPSGSGKTSLLTALAGRVPAGSGLHLAGSLRLNGAPAGAGPRAASQAFVQQEDLFYSMLTVQETLSLASELGLPPSMSADQRAAYTSHLVAQLGLAKAADTCVGDDKTRGLSGGEKKRLNIGCELVGSPSLIFADEPTTGLDAFQAEKVMITLKTLAAGGHTVIASIHQPRSSVFALFDDLVLLSEGQPIYTGPAEQALPYFEALGHPCPEHYNPAEFLADLVSIDFTSPEAEQSSRARVERLVGAWRAEEARQRAQAGAAGAEGQEAPSPGPSPRPGAESASRAGSSKRLGTANGNGSNGNGSNGNGLPAPRVGFLKQLRLLLGRAFKQVVRDRATNMSRLSSQLSSALVFGSIYFRMGRGQSAIQDRLGLLQVSAIGTAMTSIVKTLAVFPRERTIVSRERARGAYGVLPYLTAKLAAELPIGALFPCLFGSIVYPLCGLNPSPRRFATYLAIVTLESFTSQALGLAVGAAVPSPEAAAAIGPAVMLVWIVFGGFFANADNVPAIFKGLPRASLIKQAFEAMCVNEFPGLTFEADANGGGMRDGKAVLQWLGFDRSSVAGRLGSQARILAFYYWATFCILRANQPRYSSVTAPRAQKNAEQQPQGRQAAGLPALPARAGSGEEKEEAKAVEAGAA